MAENAEVVHSSPNNLSWPLKVAGTTFQLSSFHFAANNTSVPLYNNVGFPRIKRLEYVDFSRPQLYLYMWDRRQAVSLSLKSPDTGRYQTRFYLAMTNLYMPLDDKGELMFEELVLLDILIRLDPYTYIDAVVGVVATGEVKLWKYSLDHLAPFQLLRLATSSEKRRDLLVCQITAVLFRERPSFLGTETDSSRPRCA